MSANFIPSQQAIKNMKPFRFWCQKVLPTVYDDSLSYYELLSKVVVYLNETVDNVDTLNDNVQNIYDAYILLQNYVNEYFDQDFPQLVSDKLDEMAEDGTLTAIIDALVDPYLVEKTAQIDLLIARMNNFMADHAGLTTETELWNGSANYVGATMQLSDSVDNYKYIEVEFQDGTNSWLQKFRKNLVLLGNACGICLPSHPSGDGAILTSYISCIRFGVSTGNANNDELSITKCTRWTWDGVNSPSVESATQDHTLNVRIARVIGIKEEQNDSEVNDIRVGYDGVIYPTAGDAVRSQIGEIHSEISSLTPIPVSVKRAMDTILQNVAFKNANMYTNELSIFHNWATSVSLSSITATYTQIMQICPDDTLDDLRTDLVVTANYDDGTSAIVTNYTLRGSLELGSNDILVIFEGKTATFNVNVTPPIYSFENGTHTFTTPAHVITVEDGNVVTVNHIANSQAIQANISKVSANTATANSVANYDTSTPIFTIPSGAHIKCMFIPLQVEYSSSGMGGRPFNVTFQKVTGGSDIPTGLAFLHNQNMDTFVVNTPVIEEYDITSNVVVGCFGTWMSSSSTSTAIVKAKLKMYVNNARWI